MTGCAVLWGVKSMVCELYLKKKKRLKEMGRKVRKKGYQNPVTQRTVYVKCLYAKNSWFQRTQPGVLSLRRQIRNAKYEAFREWEGRLEGPNAFSSMRDSLNIASQNMLSS